MNEILIYYGVYLLLSLIFLALLYWRQPQTIVIHWLLVACLPLVGWLFVAVHIVRQQRQSEDQFSDYVERQQQEHTIRRIGVFHRIQRQKELDVVPIEDALIVSGHQDRRRALIEVLKQDTFQYMEVLQQAIRNEDTETSHYAVSAIMEIKRKLLISLQDLEVRYEQEGDQEEVSSIYIDVLTAYLKSGFLDDRTMRKYQYALLGALTHHLARHAVAENLFVSKVELEVALGQMAAAERSAQQYVEQFPLSERAYLTLLKFYFNARSVSKLRQALAGLKVSPIRLSSDGLTIVRFWSKGENDEQQSQV